MSKTSIRGWILLDLSNNNSVGHDFSLAYQKGGQRRLYLKAIEGMSFVDPEFDQMRVRAQRVGFKVGGYNFMHPLDATPREVASLFEQHLRGTLKSASGLRPCLDIESGRPSPKVGIWVAQVAKWLFKDFGFRPVIYGSGYFLEALAFNSPPGPLWLAAYGKNDGREYPVAKLPEPWKAMAAHQYTSDAKVIGINGRCDLSHVFLPRSIDVPPIV